MVESLLVQVGYQIGVVGKLVCAWGMVVFVAAITYWIEHEGC